MQGKKNLLSKMIVISTCVAGFGLLGAGSIEAAGISGKSMECEIIFRVKACNKFNLLDCGTSKWTTVNPKFYISKKGDRVFWYSGVNSGQVVSVGADDQFGRNHRIRNNVYQVTVFPTRANYQISGTRAKVWFKNIANDKWIRRWSYRKNKCSAANGNKFSQ